jgi:Xaa-Pro aminopeptidase
VIVPKNELENRLIRFKENMNQMDENWQTVVIFGKINTYYFTGTMQNGVLIIRKNDESVYFVRKSYERAKIESKFENIIPIKSYRNISEHIKLDTSSVHLEMEITPVAVYERFNKYFQFKKVLSADLAIMKTRAVKSEFEISLMKEAGKIHEDVLENIAPSLLEEGISEAELGAKILNEKILRGHQGIIRMGTFNAELFLGNVCFGENANYYNSFDGPGGVKGICPAVPLMGNFDRKLKKNDLLYIDSGCGYMGYHTDKTCVYYMGKVPNELKEIHVKCVEIQNKIASMLVPGAIPSEIYDEITSNLEPEFEKNFMGFETNKVKFLAHGIGLVIDEYPVIAKGFDEPVQENMVFAIEPKNFIKDKGLLGVENTFIVTKNGGVSITGNQFDIIEI